MSSYSSNLETDNLLTQFNKLPANNGTFKVLAASSIHDDAILYLVIVSPEGITAVQPVSEASDTANLHHHIAGQTINFILFFCVAKCASRPIYIEVQLGRSANGEFKKRSCTFFYSMHVASHAHETSHAIDIDMHDLDSDGHDSNELTWRLVNIRHSIVRNVTREEGQITKSYTAWFHGSPFQREIESDGEWMDSQLSLPADRFSVDQLQDYHLPVASFVDPEPLPTPMLSDEMVLPQFVRSNTFLEALERKLWDYQLSGSTRSYSRHRKTQPTPDSAPLVHHGPNQSPQHQNVYFNSPFGYTTPTKNPPIDRDTSMDSGYMSQHSFCEAEPHLISPSPYTSTAHTPDLIGYSPQSYQGDMFTPFELGTPTNIGTPTHFHTSGDFEFNSYFSALDGFATANHNTAFNFSLEDGIATPHEWQGKPGLNFVAMQPLIANNDSYQQSRKAHDDWLLFRLNQLSVGTAQSDSQRCINDWREQVSPLGFYPEGIVSIGGF